MGATTEMEPVPKQKPFLRFIFLAHGKFPENPQPLLNRLSDTNIIFIEAVGFTQTSEERARVEHQFNFAMADFTNSPEFQDPQRELINQLEASGNFINQLIARLGKNGKRAFLVDIDKNHPSHPLLLSVKEDATHLTRILEHGQLAEARVLFRDLCVRRSTINRIREEEVKNQIESTVTHLEQKGVSVRAAVIQGLIHTPTAMLFDDSFSVEMEIFASPIPLQGEIWMNLRNGKPVSETDFDRSLLVDHILPFEENGSELKRLTPEQVSTALSQFTQLYEQEFRLLTPKNRRLTIEEKNSYAPFAFEMTRIKLLEAVKQWV